MLGDVRWLVERRRERQHRSRVWNLAMADSSPESVASLQRQIKDLIERSQYGWGQTIDFGPFSQPGLLGELWLEIANLLDNWSWWPTDLAGLRIADIGTFSGGHAALLAGRGAEEVVAIDEIPEHLEQCAVVAAALGLSAVRPVLASLYSLEDQVPENSLDLALVSGVLYHMSDMLVGLMRLQERMKPNGILILETAAVNDRRHSYANFGRFVDGMWWQPTTLCIQDMLEFSGFSDVEIRFFGLRRCLVRARKSDQSIRFTRGLSAAIGDVHDGEARSRDHSKLAPARRWFP